MHANLFYPFFLHSLNRLQYLSVNPFSLNCLIKRSNDFVVDSVGCISTIDPVINFRITLLISYSGDGFCQSIVSTVHMTVLIFNSRAIFTVSSR